MLSKIIGKLQLTSLVMGIAAFGLVACETTPPPPPPEEVVEPMVPDIDEEEFVTVPKQRRDEVVRIAILLPFSAASEDVQEVSKGMLKAAQMVAFESQNTNYLLIPKDTKGTAEGAAQVAEEAIREGAEIILGPLYASSVTAVSQFTRPMNIPVIAFSTDSRVAGNGVYLLSFPPEPEISRITEYVLSKGYSRFGLMAPFSEYGDQVAQVFSSEVYNRGGSIVHTERYAQTGEAMQAPAQRMAQYADSEFIPSYVTPRRQGVEAGFETGAQRLLGGQPPFYQREAVTAQQGAQSPYNQPLYGEMPYGDTGSLAAMAAGGYQAVLLPEQGRLVRSLAPLFPYNNVNIRQVKLLGLSGWNNPGLAREPALAGGWFAAPDPSLAEGFKKRYRAAYGDKPLRLASLAYDAALLTARLSQLPPEKRFSVDTIANPNGYLGADGLFRLRADGMVERGLAVLEIQPSGIKVIDPAPRSFSVLPTVGQTGF